MLKFNFSLALFKNLWYEEPQFKHEIYATVVLLPLAWWWPNLALEWRLGLTASWLLVMMAEAFHRALCAVIDSIFIDYHPLLQRARQLSTLGVSIALVLNLIVWAVAVYKHGPF